MRAIRSYHGSVIVQCALKLAPLVFIRPGELRKAEWTELNLDTAEWRIPADGQPCIDPRGIGFTADLDDSDSK